MRESAKERQSLKSSSEPARARGSMQQMPGPDNSANVGPRMSSRHSSQKGSTRDPRNTEASTNRRTSFRKNPTWALEELEPPPKPKCHQAIRNKSRYLSDSFRFAILTTVLTVYALFGDDFRLAVTRKNTDILFDIVTILCILIFVTEIVCFSIGKEDYFLGFFFWLDVLSTATLVLDLTLVGNWIFCAETEGSALKTSRAGRAGARAGRTVRIIRLMRLVKLYKTYKTHMEEKEKHKGHHGHGDDGRPHRGSRNSQTPGEDLDEEDFHEAEQDDHEHKDGDKNKNEKKQEPQAETRVGKKLGDMTTRRVIILVLVMLFCMPQFLPSSHGFEDFRSSVDMGMEFVYDTFRQYCLVNSTSAANAHELPWCLHPNILQSGYASTDAQARARKLYEDFYLMLVYSHHAGSFSYALYWLGMSSKALVNYYKGQGSSESEAEELAGDLLGFLAPLSQQAFLGDMRLPTSSWDAKYADSSWQSPLLVLPDVAKRNLVSRWGERCAGNFWGVPLVETDGDGPCSLDEDLRCSEVMYFGPLDKTEEEEDQVNFVFAFSTRGFTTVEAGLNMLQTLFICCCVGIGAMTFSNDANQLLLKPIERMISKMESIKDNPLEAMRLGDLEYRREEIENANRKEKFAQMGRCMKIIHTLSMGRKMKEPMETVILEKTIIKLGGLLALGFGEAGAEIIGHNMTSGHSAGVNAMVPGQKVDAIIGYATIRDFLAVNEVLKEKVMLFVNQVGEIVHGCVDDYNGAPNKNIGDSFLLIWRLSGADPASQMKLADMAIMSFIRIVTEINKSPVLGEYRRHPGILQHVPDYRVQLGFGLHCGWAIEGAIGSEFKIDASYLSPNVNVAVTLESATLEYRVWFLMSHYMINLCSKELGMLFRVIDHVMVRGHKQPMRLFTIDLAYMELQTKHANKSKFIKNRFKIRQIREAWKQEKWNDEYRVWEAFDFDEDLMLMRQPYMPEFFRRFATAYRNYETGSWKVARDLLYTCHYTPRINCGKIPVMADVDWPEDGPTNTLLKFMQQANYRAPADWPGYRELHLAKVTTA
mmetsp:Transcript_31950/g.56407  ORF Transcript_31950/g.56407 Transcript_31950/m.56407 type:complete len:1044 (-) Transcript_31950:87-3218(-)